MGGGGQKQKERWARKTKCERREWRKNRQVMGTKKARLGIIKKIKARRKRYHIEITKATHSRQEHQKGNNMAALREKRQNQINNMVI